MNERTLVKIEEEIVIYAEQGNLGKVMDLVDEHGNTIDQMLRAILNGDLDEIYYLEQFGIDITEEHFVLAAVRNDQLMVIANQVRRGLNADRLIEIADKEGNQLIFQWAKCWKSVNAHNSNRSSS